MNNSLIKASHLSKSFHGVSVLNHVDLTIAPEKILTIIGPNGSGKTTLIRLLLGLETPDSGTVSKKNGLKIGYVPQAHRIDYTMPITAGWFLALYAGAGNPKLGEMVREMEVEALLEKPLQALSGGEMQRIMLVRALMNEPELLVLDEPAQGVDVNGQAALYALIARISREHHCAVLMVSHDLHLVMSATDHVICLNHHICCSGHPHSVRGDPAFATMFGQHVADSLAVYTHHHDHSHA